MIKNISLLIFSILLWLTACSAATPAPESTVVAVAETVTIAIVEPTEEQVNVAVVETPTATPKPPTMTRAPAQGIGRTNTRAKDDAVMMYVPEHQQVVKGTLTQIAASKGPLALLLGVGKLSQQFTVLDSPEASRKSQKVPELTLIPKPDGEKVPTIKKIHLQLFPDSYLIQTIEIFEVSGNISRVRFDHIQVNQGLSANLLKFTLPPDVVVVEFPTF